MSWGHNLSPRYNKFVAGMVSYRDLAKPVSRIGVSGALLIATPAFFWYLGEATTKEGLKAEKFPLAPAYWERQRKEWSQWYDSVRTVKAKTPQALKDVASK